MRARCAAHRAHDRRWLTTVTRIPAASRASRRRPARTRTSAHVRSPARPGSSGGDTGVRRQSRHDLVAIERKQRGLIRSDLVDRQTGIARILECTDGIEMRVGVRAADDDLGDRLLGDVLRGRLELRREAQFLPEIAAERRLLGQRAPVTCSFRFSPVPTPRKNRPGMRPATVAAAWATVTGC